MWPLQLDYNREECLGILRGLGRFLGFLSKFIDILFYLYFPLRFYFILFYPFFHLWYPIVLLFASSLHSLQFSQFPRFLFLWFFKNFLGNADLPLCFCANFWPIWSCDCAPYHAIFSFLFFISLFLPFPSLFSYFFLPF